MRQQIILTVDYTTDQKYYSESTIRNKIYSIDSEKNIHDQIAEIIKEEDYCEISYKNKPRGNIFIDTKDNDPKIVGYMYRGKQEIYNDQIHKHVKVNFDVWVSIKKVEDFEFETIEN